MKDRHATLFMFVGGWLSLVALVVGGSVLLPPARSASDASTALLYRYAGANVGAGREAPRDTGRSIVADLDTMHLTLYEEGVRVKTFPILSKGRPGTPWETPAGNYVIQAREIKHRSSIGGTWMPYSMQFYGNFFIHGWPTYDDGRAVPLGYSGGCIRLSTEDAREVYEFIPKGARVSVLGALPVVSATSTARYYLRGDGVLPEVSSPSFVIADIQSGYVLWSRNGSSPMSPRGLSRMVTALTALETVNQYKIVRMSELLLGKAILRKYSIGAIDEMPAGALIYPLLFDTNDTAAQVFAREHGERQFVAYMNEKSAAMGMHDTVFSGNASTDAATTTGEDLVTLLAYIKNNKNFLINATLATSKTLTSASGDERFEWKNRNPWVVAGDAALRGGIVDINSAGDGGAMLLFDVPLSEFSSRTIAFVILDSTQVEKDIASLRQFVSDNFFYGVHDEGALFIREEGEPSAGLLEKAKNLIDLGDWLLGGKA